MQFFNYRPSWPLFNLVAELKKRRTAGALMLYSEWILPPDQPGLFVFIHVSGLKYLVLLIA